MNDDIVLLSTNTETEDKRVVISEYVIEDTAASLQRNLTH